MERNFKLLGNEIQGRCMNQIRGNTENDKTYLNELNMLHKGNNILVSRGKKKSRNTSQKSKMQFSTALLIQGKVPQPISLAPKNVTVLFTQ